MEERLIATLDLGSSRIVLTVAKITGEDIQILYYKGLPSEGIRNSAVFNPQKASVPIKNIIADAEKELGIKIKQVVLGLPRCNVRQEMGQASAERANPDDSITREEIEALKALAQREYPHLDHDSEAIYCSVAQSFSDDENFQLIENDIIGVISQNVEGHFKLLIGKKNAIRTIEKIFGDAGIGIAAKYFSPLSQAKAVLTDDEVSSGVALMDIGAEAASVVVYQGRIMRHFASIPFGGRSITTDIKNECFISEKLAENIKLAYGACMPEKLQTLGEKTLQIEGDETENNKQIPVKYLSEIITARVKEIVEALLYEIQQSGLADSLRCGLVLTGGCANLTNIAMFVRDLSGYSVRTGYPRRRFSASGCPGIMDPEATTSLGLILSAKEDGIKGCTTAPAAAVKEETPQPENTSSEVNDEKIEETPAVPAFRKLSWKRFIGKLDERVREMGNENI